jgi:protein-S-isoprenylcysteine O-methyltransferase Ste14
MALIIPFNLAPEKIRGSPIVGTIVVGILEISRIAIILFDPTSFVLPYFLNFIIGIPIFLTAVILETIAAIKIKWYGFSGTAENETLYTEGIYGIVRHPIYSCEIIWPVGLVIILGGVYSIFMLIIWTLFFIIHAKLEERNLIKLHGDKYREYKKQVPMLFPLKFRRKRRT